MHQLAQRIGRTATLRWPSRILVAARSAGDRSIAGEAAGRGIELRLARHPPCAARVRRSSDVEPHVGEPLALTERAIDAGIDADHPLRRAHRQRHANQRPARHAVHRADHAGTVGIEAEAGGGCLLHRLGGRRQRFALALKGVDARDDIGNLKPARRDRPRLRRRNGDRRHRDYTGGDNDRLGFDRRRDRGGYDGLGLRRVHHGRRRDRRLYLSGPHIRRDRRRRDIGRRIGQNEIDRSEALKRPLHRSGQVTPMAQQRPPLRRQARQQCNPRIRVQRHRAQQRRRDRKGIFREQPDKRRRRRRKGERPRTGRAHRQRHRLPQQAQPRQARLVRRDPSAPHQVDELPPRRLRAEAAVHIGGKHRLEAVVEAHAHSRKALRQRSATPIP